MELKENLRYAEFALAKTMREKEAVEAQKRQQAAKVADLNSALRQRDEQSQKMDDMFRNLEN